MSIITFPPHVCYAGDPFVKINNKYCIQYEFYNNDFKNCIERIFQNLTFLIFFFFTFVKNKIDYDDDEYEDDGLVAQNQSVIIHHMLHLNCISDSSNTPLIAGVVVGSLVLILIGFLLFLVIRRRKEEPYVSDLIMM